MKKLALALAAFATIAGLAPQDALAKHHNHWKNNNRFYSSSYGMRYNNNNNWRNRRYNRNWNNGYWNNGMYINNGVGADGYPAWMGGYRPGRGR